MRRAALLGALAWAALAAGARAQLVPLARCHAAFPCSLPYGLRPPDAVTNLPDAGFGNSLVGVGLAVDNGLKPRLVASPVSEDPVEGAARLFLRRNPLRVVTPTPTPAPTAPPAAGSPP